MDKCLETSLLKEVKSKEDGYTDLSIEKAQGNDTMKVKEISQMANIAWSPAGERPSYLACGTTAKQLDASFNTNSSLILYNLNTGQSNLEMKLTASIESPAR
ncbi:Protein transport protein Sec31A [Portunus trituberculatus]|uniref:Protein transport protein Sec31A n=1 Tax=Portunus trituberculatus TaxID=210409 RepID=A0A5B7G7H4_PORTR|nr:Protein transport protein Sec31A [Portunus trituberculatus]